MGNEYSNTIAEILSAIVEAKTLPRSREASLVVTKLEEAYLWAKEAEAGNLKEE